MWLAVLLAAVAFALRVRHLGASDLTFDESVSAYVSAMPCLDMIKYLLAAFRDLPPGYYMLLRAWEMLAGRSEFALRYFSVWFGVLGVALVGRLGRRGLGTGAGLVAALLLTIQPFHAYYSQDARPYTLAPVLAMLMVYCFDALCRKSNWRRWIAFGATCGAAVLTHQALAFVIAALCVYLLLHARAHRRLLLPWFGGLALAGGLAVLWLFASRSWKLARRVLSGWSWPMFWDRLTLGRGLLSDVAFGLHWRPPPEWLALIAVLALTGMVISVGSRRWRTLRPGGAWLLPAWIIIPTLLLIAIPEQLEARYNAAIVPAVCLILAQVIAWLWEQNKLTRALALPVLAFIVYIQVVPLAPTLQASAVKSNYGHVIAYLRRHVQPGDVLILNGDWQWVQLKYYLAPELPTYWLPQHTPPGLDPQQAKPELDQALKSKRIWVLPTAVEQADPQRFVAAYLGGHAYLTSSYHDLLLYTVAQSPHAPQPLDPPVTWDDAVRLESVSWKRQPAVPGEPLLFDLNWRILRAPLEGQTLRLDLADTEGGVRYSTERELGEFFAPPQTWKKDQVIVQRVGLPVPPGTPPGEYEIHVGVVGSSPDSGGDFAIVPDIAVLSCGTETPCTEPIEGDDYTALQATFGEAVTLSGYQPGGREFFPGNYASVTLYWRAERALGLDVQERLVLVDRAGRVVAQTQAMPVAAWYPSSQWTPGMWLADPRVIHIPPKTVPGEYALRVSLLAPDESAPEGRPLSVNGLDSFEVGRIRIGERPRQWRPGPISHPLLVEFGEQVRLLGYDLQPQTGEIRLTLHWQALREMDENFTVFTHVMDAGGKLVGQKDSWPRDGAYPTAIWKRGEVVKDEYVIPLTTNESGEYRLGVGLYVRATGQRLAAQAGSQHLVNDMVTVQVSIP